MLSPSREVCWRTSQLPYLAFPEVPGQTLEEYLMLNPSLQEEELQRLMREVEAALHDLHAAVPPSLPLPAQHLL